MNKEQGAEPIIERGMIMADCIYEVKRERFHLNQNNKYILQGLWPKESKAEAYLDHEPVEVIIEEQTDIGAMERFKDKDRIDAYRVTIVVNLPENLERYRELNIYAAGADKRINWFSVAVKELRKKQGRPNVFLEEINWNRKERSLQIRGWAVYKTGVQLRVYDEKKKQINPQLVWNNRPDVESLYKERKIDSKCGFFLKMDQVQGNTIYLVFGAKDTKQVYPIHLGRIAAAKDKGAVYWKKGKRYLRLYGMHALIKKAEEKVAGWKDRPLPYQKWLLLHLPTETQLQQQRKKKFDYQPCFSIVVPLYKTPKEYLEQMIESVEKQTYENWELCLSDGSGPASPLKDILRQYTKKDKRIRVVEHERSLQISENTNAAIGCAKGDFLVFMDHDDVLCSHALYACVEALNKNPKLEVLYSDEDKMTMDGHKFFQPHFKPDFNLDLLCSVNYICHLFVAKRDFAKKVGLLRREFDGAQDYDFILRCVEATDQIYHIPQILYHWRSHEDSTAENPESKSYAFEAGRQAVQAHYDRLKVKAEVVCGEYPGLYRTKYKFQEKPLISIIIPNKDHIEDLQRCMDSIDTKSSYRNYEYIIVENNSTEEKTFSFYKKLEEENENVHVVYWKGDFNYSEINNFGVGYAKGQYLLLLNNDTEIINSNCLEELLGYCMRPDVGIVGSRLYYGDDTIQHAGVVIGFGGIAGHCFVQQPRSSSGYCHRIICAQDYSAVTAACMLVKRSVFEEVGGLTSELQVAFNDIDFCLKVRRAGYLIVYNPYAELYHYESKSRGLEDTPEKVERFNREIAAIERRWPEILKNGDPYYNPNLSLETQDFSLKRLK